MNDDERRALLEFVRDRTDKRQAAYLAPSTAWLLIEAGFVEPVVKWARPGQICGVVITQAGRDALMT